MVTVTSSPGQPGRPAIERASASDRAFLAMDTGEVPEQFGVILTFAGDAGFGLPAVRRLIGERVTAVPRLRQRLIPAPFGCGGPLWVDDPEFDIGRHVRAVACRVPGDEQALLDTALSAIMSRLPRDRPLWSAVLVTGTGGRALALVMVLHHVVADGVGGLAVLGNIVDAPAAPPGRGFPRPAPARASLARDAWAGRLRSLGHAAQSWRLLRAAMNASGGLRPPRAAPCALQQPTGSHRRLAVVYADMAAVSAAAHRHGATVNDAVLVAVAGALHRVLMARGESVDTVAVAVPVSGRRPETRPGLGNMVSPMLVPVPAAGEVPGRLRQVAAHVRAHKAAASGPPPIAVLGGLFRGLAAIGGYRWYMSHQHRFHTLVSHVRGPTAPVTFGGATITAAIPAAVGPENGNTPVYFEVLSYAGTLTLAAVIDPGHFPDPSALTGALRAELGRLTGNSGSSAGGRWPARSP
jgi:diacylglycerol O-acyltransferase